jgi:2-phosphosulfolactate phosphatase
MNNSPADLIERTDVSRPLIVLSSSGTKLIEFARQSEAVYIGCLRNFASVAQHVAERHSNVAVIGAGSRHQFREEDQVCCAWIASQLLEKGFSAANTATLALVNRWPIGSLEGILTGASADYLIRSGQVRDLDFVLSHVADLEETCILDGNEVIAAGAKESDFVGLGARPRESRA